MYEKLWYLDFSNNKLTSCPSWVSNFISLELLNLRENKVRGMVMMWMWSRAMQLWGWYGVMWGGGLSGRGDVVVRGHD